MPIGGALFSMFLYIGTMFLIIIVTPILVTRLLFFALSDKTRKTNKEVRVLCGRYLAFLSDRSLFFVLAG